MKRWVFLLGLSLSRCALSFEPYGLAADGGGGDVGAPPRDAGSPLDALPMDPDADLEHDATALDAAFDPDAAVDPDASAPDGAADAGFQVILQLAMQGATDAWFHSTPPGLDCLGSGRFAVELGSAWALEAEPSPTRVFNRWNRGPCSSSTVSVCRFTALADDTLRADYNPR